MKIDMTQGLKDLDGKDLFVQEVKGGQVVNTETKLTLRSVCTEALMGTYPQHEVAGGEEKFKRYQMALKLNIADGEVEIEPEDVVLIKKLIGFSHSVVITGKAYEMLKG